eukprot:17562-Heterococcus_DN1.PRE.1
MAVTVLFKWLKHGSQTLAYMYSQCECQQQWCNESCVHGKSGCKLLLASAGSSSDACTTARSSTRCAAVIASGARLYIQWH